MRTKMKWLAAIGMVMVLLLSVCALAEGEVTETLSVSVSTKGTPPEIPEIYTVRLTAGGDYPMPAGSADGAEGKYYDIAIKGKGSASFPTIVYERPGLYTYTVKQIPGTTAGVQYDSSVFDVKVTVTNTEGGFNIVAVSRKRGETQKTSIAFVNVYPVERVSKTIRKNWDDQNNQDGIRPAELTATLTSSENMEPVTVTLNAANGWTATVPDLPRYREDTREEITYTWTEGTFPDTYTYVNKVTADNVTTITNRHEPYTIAASVEKLWDDANNQDGIRPKGDQTVRVTLLANGAEKQKVYLREANGWKATISGLPKNENGKAIQYTWKEDSTTVGYKLTGNATTFVEGGQITTLINTHETDQTTATIVKSWNDGGNQDGLRPPVITMTLFDGNTSITEVLLNADNNWRATVENLPKNRNGKAIEYTWKEKTTTAGYTVTGTSKDGTITTITNTHTPETKEITVKKVWVDDGNWDNLRKPVTLVLTASANQTAVATYTWVVKDDETLEHTFAVPVYNKGAELKYTVDEESVPAGYAKTVDDETLTVTNTHTVIRETVDIQITKSWNDDGNRDGVRPDNITVQVMQNGKEYNTVTVKGTGDLWSYMLTGLPKYDADHAEYEYTISELNVPGYTSSIQNFAITNTHEIATTFRTVTKVWNDNNNTNHPAQVTATLNADGKAIGTVTLNAANNWTDTIRDLPVNEGGKKITYTWTESAVAGYNLTSTTTAAAEGGEITTLTNTPVPANPTRYRIRVRYRYTNGREAAPTVEEMYNAGSGFDIISPVIPGYTASQLRITGTARQNEEYLVLYMPGNGHFEVITDYETPLGLGNVYINIGDCFE